MRLKIEHITTFEYTEPVSEAYTVVHLKPQDESGQHCLSFNLSVDPRGEVFQYTDYHGNAVHSFDILPAHDKLTVRAISQVLTSSAFQNNFRELEPLERFDYLRPTAYTTLSAAELAQFNIPGPNAAHPGDAGALYQTAVAIMQAVNASLTYEKGATQVSTTAAEALAIGRGVCQDYTHLMVAICRSLNIPTRYVSGYLYSPTAHASAQATHAWVDVYIEGRGWLSLDPTHNMPQSEQHVRVAVGRDYSDVTPTRGLYTGGAKEKLNVKVRVRPD